MITTLGNIYYYPLKLYVYIASFLYFKKLRVVGLKQHVPQKGPLIFAINHQNALLDALLMSVLSWRNPHFLTRADIFKPALVDRFLRGLKMLPIYRIRDGYYSVKRNEAIFKEAKKILTKGGVMGIFPEGTHGLHYKIKPLKKGVARIAFMTEEAADFNLGLKVIPIGIQYESHFFSRGRTLVSFGKPIPVSDYKEIYLQDQNKAHEQLVEKISAELNSLVLTIDGTEEYDRVLNEFLRLRVYKQDLQKQLIADQALVDSIEKGSSFDYQSDTRNPLLQFLGNIWAILWKVIGFIPKAFVDFLIKKTTKDPHFYGTNRFVYSVFLYPVIFLLMWFLIKSLLL
jgi:1-acyl-sn-glycerol-3-phosphate acyltransferase